MLKGATNANFRILPEPSKRKTASEEAVLYKSQVVRSRPSCLLENAIVAFSNLARLRA
ncbi:hypothetical protein Enr8_19380 [Blastopirellula retiformator]|uniref:Uncharacterized protein n=1 Tax=Blastopirellula retiformator TaxID=2527970 RepID=A0A5C5V9I4_9BACT|nr:hypothetical protein Enr8_19380 [Blastopirellula retiformator]